MMSDTLWEAIRDIRSYQERMPWIYESRRAKIEAVVEKMQELQWDLDCPPRSDEP